MSRRRERGAVSLELAVITPAILLIFVLVAFAGRMATANGTVEQAAADAARAASLSQGPSAAQQAAQDTAAAALSNSGLQCLSLSVNADTSGFATAPGQQANVTVTITCPVRLADLPLPGLGSRTVTASAVSPIDTYRQR